MGRTVAPAAYSGILQRSQAMGFGMNSDTLTGSLLRTLAATKPGGSFLELGTGCGVGTSWILDGMDQNATLTSVDSDEAALGIARDALGTDPRVRFVRQDGSAFLASTRQSFDLIYADTWPGKYTHLESALAIVNPGGIYIVDDMLPQPNWPPGHDEKAAALMATLTALEGFQVASLEWSTGLVICVKSRS